MPPHNNGTMVSHWGFIIINYYCFTNSTNIIAGNAKSDSKTEEIAVTVTYSYCLIPDESRCVWKCSGRLIEEPQKP